MAVVLASNAYGKSRVRLTKVERHPDRHDLFEWSLDIQLTGDFALAYREGDNRQVIATDTMKNTVYALSADGQLGSPEAFGLLLGKHFLSSPQVASATITIHVEGWQRLTFDGQEHPHAFVGSGAEQRTCTVTVDRSHETVTTGLTGLMVLKTTDSAWRDFHRDSYRTLPDADDRILATSVTAEWTYAVVVDWNAVHAEVRQTMIETFANHKSLGAQHTLHAMGEAVLDRVPTVETITITLPNRHRIPFNLTPLGRENTNSIFVATDEPHGLISGTLTRS
ncbi:urate oxidase [soil metagenome]